MHCGPPAVRIILRLMALTAGTRLGPYEIVAALGAGGMGEVYRATDTTLKRQVAIKVIPALLADPERLARLQREAEVLASLNHPHIAAVYGLEHANGVKALVMELVEGEDLAQALAHRRFSIDEALLLAKQIAEALEAAHSAGVIHRDLKPANIKVRPDGTVKVLDFGLAKLAEIDGETSGQSSPAHSPTITSPAMTNAGMILGTAAYMSPEQARGRAADRRSDIWAFGAVLFEILTGERAFDGETISDTLASVLKSDPNWQRLPPETSPRLRRLLRWCLDKDPKQRLRDIGDARLQIDEIISGEPEEPDRGAPVRRPAWQRVAPWTLAGLLAAVLIAVLALGVPWRTTSPTPLIRLSAELGAGTDTSVISGYGGDALAFSPDGMTLAFVGQKVARGSVQIFVRPLNQSEATPIAGTDGGDSPFFSPDGKWIAFFADGKLKKTAIKGGSTIEIASASVNRGGDWGDDDTIYFLPDRIGPLLKVSASTRSTPEPVAPLADGEITQRWPQVLPGGKGVLYTSSTSPGNHNNANIVVQRLPAGERTIVYRGGYHGRYLPSGHLAFVRDSTLFVAPFDLDQLKATAPPVPVLDDVLSNAGTGASWFAISHQGIGAYVRGHDYGGEGIPIYWIDHQAQRKPLKTPTAPWLNLKFSPDGNFVAFQVSRTQNDVWIRDVARGSEWLLTSDPGPEMVPVWTPDSRWITYAAPPPNSGTTNLYIKLADGSGNATRLTESARPQVPGSWDSTSRFLAFEEVSGETKSDVMILPIEKPVGADWKAGKPYQFAASQYDERQPAFSPDGRWIAYVSNQSGRNEIQVRPFNGSGQVTVSTGGGTTPTWSQTKRELYYGVGSGSLGQIMVVSYTVEGNQFRPSPPQLLPEILYQTRGPNRMFDLHKDGVRFAIAPSDMADPSLKRDRLTFLFNFFDELRRIAPPR